jgi:hypothetical protein
VARCRRPREADDSPDSLDRLAIEPVLESGAEVELVFPSRRLTVAAAWDAAYALRAQPEVIHAEPMFRYLVPENARPAGPRSRDDRAHDPATETEYDWSLRKANVLDAWTLFGSRPPGGGVEVGHPDTGYTLHPELADPSRVLASCRTPPGWDAREYGPGIVDAKELLETPLPDAAPARKLRDPRRPAVAVDATGLETLIHLFPNAPRTRVETALAALLNVSERDLPLIVQEFGDELAFHLVMNPALLQSIAGPTGRGKVGRSARPSLKRSLMKAGVSRRLRRQLNAVSR